MSITTLRRTFVRPAPRAQASRARPATHRAGAAVLSLGILAAVLTGCSDGETDASQVSVPDGAALITISSFKYSQTGTIEPGAVVTVANEDNVAHTVTSEEEGLFDVEIGAGKVATFTAPQEPGEYSYYCIPHPDMTSSLEVVD